jgi:hypothetical protein
MRGFASKLVILLILGGAFCYLVLPGLVENQIAQRLQASFGTPTRPDVEITSNFPPEMLLGRFDRIQVSMDQGSLQGVAIYNARFDLSDVQVSVPSLMEGYPRIQTQSCSLSVEAPAVLITQPQACLGYLGLG